MTVEGFTTRDCDRVTFLLHYMVRWMRTRLCWVRMLCVVLIRTDFGGYGTSARKKYGKEEHRWEPSRLCQIGYEKKVTVKFIFSSFL